MFCRMCGAKLLYNSAKFCQDCGEACVTQTPLQTPFPAQPLPFMPWPMFGFGRMGAHGNDCTTDPSGYGGDYGDYGGYGGYGGC